MGNYKNNYPIIMIHGLLGWGDQDGIDKKNIYPYWGIGPNNLVKHLRKKGYEVYNPTLGPFNGGHDRACILWAYLFGGTVDFGKVWAEEHHVNRYGRTFEHGVLEDLGTKGDHAKINIVGHSFGGPTVKEVANLFIQGDPKEVAGTDPDDLSPLFKGGHGHLLHTVTTLSGVNNGTTFATLMHDRGMSIITYAIVGICYFLGETDVTKFYDHGMQHFGVGPYPWEYEGNHFRNPLKGIDAMRAYNANKAEGSIAREMMVEVVQEDINPKQVMSDDIYYFCHRADHTWPTLGKRRIPGLMNPICLLPAPFTSTYMPEKLEKYGMGTDKNWMKNDGYVNVTGQSAPLNQPSEEATLKDDFKPGIWYNMPIIRASHTWWNGMDSIIPTHYFKYYEKMFDKYRKLPDGEKVKTKKK